MKIINETARLVVSGEAAHPGCDVELVCLYRHDEQWHCTPRSEWQYSHFYWLCANPSGFAQQAEAGALLVNGQRVRAEEYLALWREAFKAFRPVAEVPGIALTWEIHIDSGQYQRNRALASKSGDEGEVQDLLAKTAKYRVLGTPIDVMSWSLPFGLGHFTQMARKLARLGEVDYRLPPGSYFGLKLVDAQHIEAAAPAAAAQLSLLEAA